MRVAIVGAGVVGLAATASLLRHNVDVRCYERSSLVMNERSAGSSRIFRLAHATSELVELARTAQAGYRRWEQAAGKPMLGSGGCVVSGPAASSWASAMRRGGAAHELVAEAPDRLRLPARRPPREALLDPDGGVIDVDAVRAHLAALTAGSVVHEQVHAVENRSVGASVWSGSGKTDVDVVLLAAGAATPPLAARAGIDVPGALAHHVRFSFPVPRSAGWRCWIDTPETGLGTYQHQSEPGTWSVGAHLAPALVAWSVGRDAATAVSEQTVLGYVREHLEVEPRTVGRLYCASTPKPGDGFTVRRNGAILAVHGENLFKLAPALGDVLAAACQDGSAPCVPVAEPGGGPRRA